MFDTPLEVSLRLPLTSFQTIISQINSDIDARIEVAKDSATKRVLEEDRETAVLKKKESYFGNVEFLGYLYLNGTVALKTITDCVRKLKESRAPEAINSLLLLLKICGPQLEHSAKPIVNSGIQRLEAACKSDKLPSHQVFKIKELIELRARDWKEIDKRSRLPSQVDKNPRQIMQPPMDTRKKPISSAVTPSMLAVTQQSLDSRKLGPPTNAWNKGSGQLVKNVPDGRYVV